MGEVHPGITGQLRDRPNDRAHAHSQPKDNLETPVNLTVVFLDCRRKPEYPEGAYACTGRACNPEPGYKPTTFAGANHCATIQPQRKVQ